MTKRILAGLALVSLLFSQSLSLVEAAQFRSGDVLDFANGDVLDNAYMAGNQVTIKGSQVDHDLIIAASQATIESEIKGGLVAAAGTLRLKGSVGQNARLAVGQATIEAKVGQDVVLWANQANFSKDSAISGDLIFSGNRLIIDGQVTGKVVAWCECDIQINGQIGSFEGFQVNQLSLGPQAVVEGNITYQSRQEMKVSQGASVKGSVDWQAIYGDQPGQRQILASQVFYGTLASLIFCFALAYFLGKGVDRSLIFIQRRLPLTIASGLLTLLLGPIMATALLLPSVWLGLALWLLLGLLLLSSFFMGQVVLGWWLVQWWFGRAKQSYDFDWRAPLIGALSGTICLLVPTIGPIILGVFFVIGLGSLTLSLLSLKR